MKKIAYIADLHLDEQFPIDLGIDCRENWKIILEDLALRQISQIIFGGDIGEKESNKWFFESIQNYDLKISLGNHDYFHEVLKYYPIELHKERTELYHSEIVDNYKLIILDSSSENISSQQLEWFKNECKTSKDILLFIHHPILQVDSIIDTQYALKNRDLIRDELFKIKNKVYIFSGHYHCEDLLKVNNINQYITPAASYQSEKSKTEIKLHSNSFGYMTIELDGFNVNTEIITFRQIKIIP